MGDGESSAAGGGGGGGGETVVIDQDRNWSSCGYCRSARPSSVSHGLWALSLTAHDYQELLDRGWRRSGCYLYKPEMEKTCCPSYTIRVEASDFVPSKEHVRVNKKFQRFLDGTVEVKRAEPIKENICSPNGSNMSIDSSSAKDSGLSLREPISSASKKICNQDEFVHRLSTKIDDAVTECVANCKFSSSTRLPKAIIKKVSAQTKKKLVSEDLLYTSNIAFQIASTIKKSGAQMDLSSNAGQDKGVTPNIIAEELACFIKQYELPSSMLVRACNGHLNFYSSSPQVSSMLFTLGACTQTSQDSESNSKSGSVSHQTLQDSESNSKSGSVTHGSVGLPQKRRNIEIRMKRSSFDPQEFALYKKYQIKVHGDKPEKVTENSYKRFLVDSPIIYIPPSNGNDTVPPCGFGSFHQQYVIDGKLVAVGVVDILPKCLSSKYLFWDPDLAMLSLGKYTALQEINWIKETQVHCPSLEYYYLGYYIHSCGKMRYKASYRPSELLCPLRYKWVPFDIARPMLDKSPYSVLSDLTAEDCRVSLPPVTNTCIGQFNSHLDHSDLNEDSSDDEEARQEYDVSDMWLDDDGSGPESCSTSVTDNSEAADIGNITIDWNGIRVKFKNLEQVCGPFKKKHVEALEMQLQRYVKVIGAELANHIVYSLG